MRKLLKGDDVIVITGKDKGRRGTVRQILGDKAIVDNVNMVKKHRKGNPNAGVTGGIIDKEMPIDSSNLMVFNPTTGKGDRVGVKVLDDGKKVRIFKSNGETV
ncbi:50S ribosomal protein L24 [Chromatiales bacterium (ex Bugula neritina AB1)]|nr:50S ribosomal protein L24 [Chromatiales bacterium (ex Bugula neritina AB1)]